MQLTTRAIIPYLIFQIMLIANINKNDNNMDIFINILLMF